MHAYTGTLCLCTNRGKCTRHFSTRGFERLHRRSRHAGDLINPVTFAHGVGIVFKDAVHGSHVIGDGSRISLSGCGEYV